MQLQATVAWTATLALVWAAVSLAQNNNRTHTGRIEAHDVTVREGTPTAYLPITVTLNEADTTITGLYATVNIGTDLQTIPIVPDNATAFRGSIWNDHPNVIQQIFPMGADTAGYMQIHGGPPFDTLPRHGLAHLVTVDTSRTPPGEYQIDPGHRGFTSATMTSDGLSYWPVVLTTISATLRVVPDPEIPAGAAAAIFPGNSQKLQATNEALCAQNPGFRTEYRQPVRRVFGGIRHRLRDRRAARHARRGFFGTGC